jgi:hypothetical protein
MGSFTHQLQKAIGVTCDDSLETRIYSLSAVMSVRHRSYSLSAGMALADILF